MFYSLFWRNFRRDNDEPDHGIVKEIMKPTRYSYYNCIIVCLDVLFKCDNIQHEIEDNLLIFDSKTKQTSSLHREE